MKKVYINTRITNIQKERIEDYRKKEQLSISEVVRKAIDKFFKK